MESPGKMSNSKISGFSPAGRRRTYEGSSERDGSVKMTEPSELSDSFSAIRSNTVAVGLSIGGD